MKKQIWHKFNSDIMWIWMHATWIHTYHESQQHNRILIMEWDSNNVINNGAP